MRLSREAQRHVASHQLEVAIASKKGKFGSDRDCGYEAVEQSTRGDATGATTGEDGGRTLPVLGADGHHSAGGQYASDPVGLRR